jgi:predicted permease
MTPLPGLRRVFRLSAFRPNAKDDLDAELAFHFRATEDELLTRGFSRTEAREEAHRRFGDLSRYRKELSRIDRGTAARNRRSAWVEAVLQDLSYVVRGLGRAPGFTAAVVLTLALGIGANATMFSVVDHLLLSPPAHVQDPGGVVRLHVHRTWDFIGRADTFAYLPFADYQDFANAGTLASTATYATEQAILGRDESAERVNVHFSTASFFPLLGVVPELGRFFDDTEDASGAPGVVVLAHGIWQRRFGERDDVIGESVSIGDGTYTVIGVAPEGFNGVDLEPVDLFVPAHAYTTHTGSEEWATHRGYYMFQGLGRMAPSSAREAVVAETTALHLNGRRDLIDQDRYPADAKVVLGSIHAALGPDAPEEVRVSRWLVGVTLIVLLIACANVANLMLARGARRRRELGIRTALGISRRRLVGQLLLESLVLAGLGGGLGLAAAYWGGQVIQSGFLPQVAWPPSPVNQRVLLFTLAVSVATGILAGITPALRHAREGLADSLKEGGRGGTARRSRSQAGLLVAQVALSVVLLAGAGLFVKSLVQARTMDLGLDPEGLVVATLELEGEWETEARMDLADRAVRRLEALPGVANASVASRSPFSGMAALNLFVPGMDSLPAPPGVVPLVTTGSHDHLSNLGIQVRQGRMFTQDEVVSGARVAVVTENMARGIWRRESALGQCLLISARESPCWEVVGVVEPSRLTELTGDEPWQYYLPLSEPAIELGAAPGVIMVRATGDARALLGPIRRELGAIDPNIRFAHVRLQQDLIDPELRPWRLGATMFSLFGMLAVLVAAVGLYSVLAFNVARRTRELGVRSAMGASRTRLLRMVLREAMGVTGLGILLGLTAALVLAGFLEPLLFGTSARDPSTLLSVAGCLMLVALAAGAIPAWAAARVDPMGALRTD